MSARLQQLLQKWKQRGLKRNPISQPTSSQNPFDSVRAHTAIVSANKTTAIYCQNGQLELARKLFDRMRARTVVSWNTMITGYSKWEKFPEALSLISSMHHSDVKLNEATFSKSLSVCGRSQSLPSGKQIHGLVLKSGHEGFALVGSALLYLYSSCYEIGEARRVFDELQDKNDLLWSLMLAGYVQCNLLDKAFAIFVAMPKVGVVEWTTIISGYAKSDDKFEKAFELFGAMRESGEVVPNEYTFDCVLRACGRFGYLCQGMGVHGLLVKCGFELERSISGALIDFYCGNEMIDDAKRVYEALLHPCLDHFNLLIRGLVELGRIEEAELIFVKLNDRNSVACNLMLKGYAMCGQAEDAKKLFEEMPVRTLSSIHTMISMYGQIGEIDKALALFEDIKGDRNFITWNSMITAYVQNDQHGCALELYLEMHRLSIAQTRSTFSVLFHACACLGSLQQGQILHAHLAKSPIVSNVYVGTALVDMYSKCGSIIDAQASFSCISHPNVAAWTALISGHAYHGLGSDAILLFNSMLNQGIAPNAKTFTALLSGCTRAGLVDEGSRIFSMMKEFYGVVPTLEHFTCIVDLWGRAGRLREAEELVRDIPIEADKILLMTLLNACWVWMDMEVGQRVVEKMFSLDPKPSSACIIMSNMYSGSGKWVEKMEMRDFLREMEVKKDPGCSWIELDNVVHVFSVDDRNHPCCNIIYGTLEHLTENFSSSIQFNFISS